MKVTYNGEIWDENKLARLTKGKRKLTWAWRMLSLVNQGKMTMEGVLQKARALGQPSVKKTRKQTIPVLEKMTRDQGETLAKFGQIHRGELSINDILED